MNSFYLVLVRFSISLCKPGAKLSRISCLDEGWGQTRGKPKVAAPLCSLAWNGGRGAWIAH